MINPLVLIRFAAVAQHLSFVGAAQALGIDQATLSRQIKQLERSLGFDLLVRTTRSVALTLRGEALLPVARTLADAYEEAGRRIAVMVNANDTSVRFGMHPYVYWSTQVRTIMDRFAEECPGASINTASGITARTLARLQDGSLDAALLLDGPNLAGLERQPVMIVTPNLLLPEEHPLVTKATLALADTAKLTVATFRPERDRSDFDRVYGAFFEAGTLPLFVSEGTAAVSFRAATERLAMISLRPFEAPASPGFVRRAVVDAPRLDFVLARCDTSERSIANRFWNCAIRALEY
ncbi:MAG: LysR family transcriptional regulator [Rhodobiaceae bacterium]|nr:LysR family transcriptional regulator [Novosphingobium sp.]MCC0057580.1 LysR family transcriptional regulator [Rhodobiaceae bacterium]